MDKRKILRRVVTALICIVLSPLLALFGYMEYKLISFPVTDMGDTAGVIAVNTGEPYYVANTTEGALENFDNSDRLSHNVEQVIIAKYLHNFDEEYLRDIGCTEVDRMGDVGYYEAPNGLRFAAKRSYRASRLFCTFRLWGATIEEIEAN